eukprot:c9998_g1_i1.p1 GENE.c9998_g1_i1~~c9998_g1_i1.p1  ORF type:complete len:615 (-),score=129.60 c9998_g1_i1:913-2493(-)
MKDFGYNSSWELTGQLTANELKLLHWVEAEGLESPCVTIGHFRHPNFVNHTLRGLVANCSLIANKDILRIPTKLIITAHRIRHTPMYDAIAELLALERSISFDLDHILLTLFIMFEKQDQNSYWLPYIQLLPEEVFVPCESDSYNILWFDASRTIANTQTRQRAIDWQYDHLSLFFSQHPQLLPKFRHFNRPLFQWAYHTVTSRSFRLDFGVHKDTLCLVPYADLMNHNFANVGWLFRGKQVLSFYSGEDIRYGDQVFNFYGNLGNEVFSQDFGFVTKDNPFTCAHVMFPPIEAEDQYREKRLALLKSANLEPETPICVRFGPPTRELLFAALVHTAGGEDLANNLTPDNFAENLNELKFEKLMGLISTLLQKRLSEYKYTVQQDERLLPLLVGSANSNLADRLSLRRFNAVYLRREEKLILNSTLSFVNLSYHCPALPPTFSGAEDKIFSARALRGCNRYLKKIVIPLLLDLSWEQSFKGVKAKQHHGPWENWDFRQDPTVYPKEGQPAPLCPPGGDQAACAHAT